MMRFIESTGIFASVSTAGAYIGTELITFIQNPPHVLSPVEFINVLNDGSQAAVPQSLGAFAGLLAGIVVSGLLIGKNMERLDWKDVGKEYETMRQQRRDLERLYSQDHATDVMRGMRGMDPVQRRHQKPSRPRA